MCVCIECFYINIFKKALHSEIHNTRKILILVLSLKFVSSHIIYIVENDLGFRINMDEVALQNSSLGVKFVKLGVFIDSELLLIKDMI